MTKIQTLILCVGIILFSVLVAVGISSFSGKPDKKDTAQVAPLVNTLAIQPEEHLYTIHSQGRVQSRQTTQLSSEVSGKVFWISDLFNEGKSLKKGYVIARIDKSQYESNLAQAQANLAQAELSLAEEKARVAQAKEDWDNLLATGENTQEEDANQLVLRTPHLKQAAAQVQAMEAAVKKAAQDLKNTEIRMPFSGIIDTREISTGQFINVGSQIANLLGEEKEVRLPLTSKQASKIINNKAPVTLHYEESKTQALLSHVDGNLDPNTQVIYATAKLPVKSLIPVGAFVSAEIESRRYPMSLRLPLSAIHQDQNNQHVFYIVTTSDKTLKPITALIIQKDKEEWLVDIENTTLDKSAYIVTTRLPLMKAGLEVNILETGNE